MNRRDFIALVSGAATGWPRAAHAQQQTIPMIGFLRSVSLADAADLVTAFRFRRRFWPNSTNWRRSCR
jgi:putative ABC transport system substrate-binding protein